MGFGTRPLRSRSQGKARSVKTFTMQSIRDITVVDEGVMLALWRQGLDTTAIAKQLQLVEWQVYNRLLHIREAAR